MLTLATVLYSEDMVLNHIRFNLIVNRCTQADVGRLTEEIADFVELGPFIYAPVRTYSAGMSARLAFTIATAIEPEILLIDEILGAGDAYFIGKANKRMLELANKGKALIFVSHNIAAVQILCDTVMWLDKGEIREIGPAEQVVKSFEEDYKRQEDETVRTGNIARKKEMAARVSLEDMVSEHVNR